MEIWKLRCCHHFPRVTQKIIPNGKIPASVEFKIIGKDVDREIPLAVLGVVNLRVPSQRGSFVEGKLHGCEEWGRREASIRSFLVGYAFSRKNIHELFYKLGWKLPRLNGVPLRVEHLRRSGREIFGRIQGRIFVAQDDCIYIEIPLAKSKALGGQNVCVWICILNFTVCDANVVFSYTDTASGNSGVLDGCKVEPRDGIVRGIYHVFGQPVNLAFPISVCAERRTHKEQQRKAVNCNSEYGMHTVRGRRWLLFLRGTPAVELDDEQDDACRTAKYERGDPYGYKSVA